MSLLTPRVTSLMIEFSIMVSMALILWYQISTTAMGGPAVEYLYTFVSAALVFAGGLVVAEYLDERLSGSQCTEVGCE